MYNMCKETYKGYSPWGGVQASDIYMRGLKAVSTAGHGGYMVTKTFANKYLSESALKRAEVWSNYYCYEEDCEYTILLFDILHHHEDLFKKKFVSEKYTFEERKQSLMEILSRDFPDYLMELGIEPLDKQYKLYLMEEKESEMRRNGDSDLIVSAVSLEKGVTQVYTADNKIHFVDEESYHKIWNDKYKENKGSMLLLSKCDKVEYTGEAY